MARVRVQDEDCIVSACEDGGLKLWRVSGHLLRTISRQVRPQSRSAGVCSLAWISTPPRGHGASGWLASGNGDNSIVIFDLQDQITAGDDAVDAIPACTITDHTGPVHSLLYLEQKGWLLSGSADNTIRSWRIRTDCGTDTSTVRSSESNLPGEQQVGATLSVQAVGSITAF